MTRTKQVFIEYANSTSNFIDTEDVEDLKFDSFEEHVQQACQTQGPHTSHNQYFCGPASVMVCKKHLNKNFVT